MVEIFKNAKDLPSQWDKAIGGNFALLKDNLILLESVNPCNQRYVVFKNGETESILIHYELKLNIFCFSRLKLNLTITIIGIPCSVSEGGYSFNIENRHEIKAYLKNLKGAKVILNGEGDLDFLGFAKGYTLPTCVMDIHWNSFQEYLSHLRSHYRYRYKKALEKIKNLSIVKVEEGFSEELYSLYEQVYNKSQYKLEKLSADFFQKAKATIFEFKREEQSIAFVQYTIYDKELIFLFGGLNYKLNKEYDLYQNMLLHIVNIAIENKCTSLNLGQTAEEMKCKLGAYQQSKYLYVQHSNKIINYIAAKLINVLSYKIKDFKFKVQRR